MSLQLANSSSSWTLPGANGSNFSLLQFHTKPGAPFSACFDFAGVAGGNWSDGINECKDYAEAPSMCACGSVNDLIAKEACCACGGGLSIAPCADAVGGESGLNESYPCICASPACGSTEFCVRLTNTPDEVCTSIPGLTPPPRCSVDDGSNVSSEYPCACNRAFCSEYPRLKCNAASSTCSDAECSVLDGFGSSEEYPCVCGHNLCNDGEACHANASSCLILYGAEERNLHLLILLVPIVMFFFIWLKFRLLWGRQSQTVADEFKVSQQEEDLALSLVRFFSPSVAVNNYTFKGFKPKTQTISLSFDRLGLELADGRRVLEGVTGGFQAGRLVAIMGPSGAGKTTFMNVLCGKATYGSMVGEVRVNGNLASVDSFKSVMGFVPQDDIVHEKLTVRENLRYSAELRNAAGTKEDTLEKIVADVLNVLQIGHIQTSIVGSVEERGISGGQRKRVNIGLELAATPTLLFLDEPTSGLDSSSSLAIINSLKKMTQLGMSIIMVIHQPRYSIFTLFDTVLLLGRGGHTAYLGSSLRAKAYFESLGFDAPEHDNPADWLMDILSGECTSSEADASCLPSMWQERRGTGGQERAPIRAWTMVDDEKCVQRALHDEWTKIDVDGSNSLNRAELRLLLKRCMGIRKGAELPGLAFEHLCRKLFGDAQEVSQVEFLAFITSSMEICEPDSQGPASADSAMTKAASSTSSGRSDLGRALPGPIAQFKVICHRRLVQVFRNHVRRITDILVLITCAVILGVQHRDYAGNFGNIYLCMLALSLFLPVNCLQCFGSNSVMFARERSSGLNAASYCLARMAVDSVDVFLQGMVYICVYYVVAEPSIPSSYYLQTFALLSAVVSGWGYLISIVVPPQNAMLASVVFMLVLDGVLGNPQYLKDFINGTFSEYLVALSPTRWGLQMLFVEWFEATQKIPTGEAEAALVLVFRSSLVDQGQKILDFDPSSGELPSGLFVPRELQNHWWSAVEVLLCMAVVLRVVAMLLLSFGDWLARAPVTLRSALRSFGSSRATGRAGVRSASLGGAASRSTGAASGSLPWKAERSKTESTHRTFRSGLRSTATGTGAGDEVGKALGASEGATSRATPESSNPPALQAAPSSKTWLCQMGHAWAPSICQRV